MKLTKQTVYIGLFSILYLIVAFSSFFHACAFFGLANNSWMSIILAFAFEVGQAAVLFSLLTSTKDRSRVMPWVLMGMFTLVQVIGNVYSSYKYIIINSVENLRYFKEPIFIWTELPDAQANVIIVYLVGALLPIAALLLTSMITNYLTDQEELKNNQKNIEVNKGEESLINQNSILQMENQGLGESNKKKDNEIEQLKKELEELKQSKENAGIEEEEELRNNGSNDSIQQKNEDVEESTSEESKNDVENSIEHIEEPNKQESDTGESEPGVDDTISEGTGIEETTEEELDKEPVEEDIQKRKSHFINL